jgi:hypothetical protein
MVENLPRSWETVRLMLSDLVKWQRAIATAHGATVTARARPDGDLAIDVMFPPDTGRPGRPRPVVSLTR